jgi:hypothetical protein
VKRHSIDNLHLSKQYLTEIELRLVRQKQLVGKLRKQGLPTAQAERGLQALQTMQLKLRNHFQLMDELMQPDRYSAVEGNPVKSDH